MIINISAGSEHSADTSLNEYIRRHADLRGTKYMCLEGGCGACVVNVRAIGSSTQEFTDFSVNSVSSLIIFSFPYQVWYGENYLTHSPLMGLGMAFNSVTWYLVPDH